MLPISFFDIMGGSCLWASNDAISFAAMISRLSFDQAQGSISFVAPGAISCSGVPLLSFAGGAIHSAGISSRHRTPLGENTTRAVPPS